MARYSEDPVRHIVTFRINQEEKKILEQLAKKAGHTVSGFMRLNLQQISENKYLK